MVTKIQGKFNSAKVFTNIIEEKALEQIKILCDQEFTKNNKIRIMPDVHAGAGCTIGTTMTITDKIVPNLVGVDIGCGMECVQIQEKDIDLKELDAIIHDKIPAGFNIRNTSHQYISNTRIDQLLCSVNIDRAKKSLGTLGGGNHFIEANQDDNGSIYIVVHSGSRHMGLEIANYYQEAAWNLVNDKSQVDIKTVINQLKADGRQQDISQTIEDIKKQTISDIPKALAYVEGDELDNYIHDMNIAQEYAMWNRKAIIDMIVEELGLTVIDQFTTIHNYIDTDAMILRKGAVSAKKGEKLIIPINMRDGSLICIGKGNSDWNYSAPHGAGRLMSRTAAKQQFSVSEFEDQMQDIYTTSVNKSTLDECPMAYKNIDDIVNNIGDTVEITKIIKPIYNFKASE